MAHLSDSMQKLLVDLDKSERRIPVQQLVKLYGLRTLAKAEDEDWIRGDDQLNYHLTTKGALHVLTVDCHFRLVTFPKDNRLEIKFGIEPDGTTLTLIDQATPRLIVMDNEHFLRRTDIQALINALQNWLSHMVVNAKD